MINVLLVDDHELVRAGIRRILEDIKGSGTLPNNSVTVAVAISVNWRSDFLT
ncbi:hypothetical protein ACTZVQ_20170, partial [Klebsiella pneumoniae]